MSKYKSNQQIIGEEGETIFKLYAQQSLNLTPNKLEYDYGIDFSCQINDEPVNHKATMSAEFLLVNVKSTANSTPYSRLPTADIEFAIKAAQPLVYILVDTIKREVYHRFFDEELLIDFHAHLLKNKKSFRIDPSKMNNNETHFKEQLSTIRKSKYQNRLRLLKAQLGLQQLIGNVKLKLMPIEDGSLAVVEVDEVSDLFDKTHKLFPYVRESFLSIDYNKISLPKDAFKNLYEQLDDIADFISLSVPLNNDVFQVMLKRKGKEIAACYFERREFGDEIAYYHPCGLSMTLSKRRQGEDNQFYHITEIIISEKSADNMFEYPEFINFLGKIQAGDTINELSVVDYWPELLDLGFVVRNMLEIYKILAIEPHVQLRELSNKDIIFSYKFIKEHLLNKRKTLIHYVNTEDDISSLKTEKHKISCPFLINLPEGQYLLTIQFDSVLYFEDLVSIVGIKTTKNPIVKACSPIESNGIVEPLLLLTKDAAFSFSSNKDPKLIKNPLDLGISVLPTDKI